MGKNLTKKIFAGNEETKAVLLGSSKPVALASDHAVSKFSDVRLSVSYASDDPNLPQAFYPQIVERASRISLIICFPFVLRLPDFLLKIIQDFGDKPIEVLIIAPNNSPPDANAREKVGILLSTLHHCESMKYRWTDEKILSIGSKVNSGTVLILQEATEEGQTIILSVTPDDAQTIKVNWSWGDPLQRAKVLVKQFSSAWENASNQSFAPTWDALGLNTTAHTLPPLYKHQIIALQAWEKNRFQGIFEMCTGAGKTVAALAGSLLLQQRLNKADQQLSAVIILCPKKVLVDQWERQLIANGFSVAAIVCDSPQNYRNQLDTALRGNKTRYIVSTYDSFVLPLFQALIKGASALGRRGLLIADEMHWSASVDRRDCLRRCDNYFPWRLGLSATPEIENDEIATRQLSEFFGGVLKEARYGLEEALADKVLCPYMYIPVPTFLDLNTSAKYFDILRQTSESKGKVDLTTYSERRRILRKGEIQITALNKICDRISVHGKKFDHTLVFCPPGDDYDDLVETGEEMTPLINKIKLIFQEREILCTSILAETKDRDEVLKEFERGDVAVLLAIGCLDEGMDVPSTRRAIMLYSVDRLRQFVQRRGRVLRKHSKKETAEIIDLIVLPHNADLSESVADDLLRRELRRYTEFARLAINSKEAQSILDSAIKTASEKKSK